MAESKLVYEERDLQAVHSVLIELGQVLGTYHQRFVIVGGAVPWLLFPNGEPPHVGTTDIDLNLDPDGLADGEYATLVETLLNKGYQRDVDDLKPFQLRRWVPVDEGDPVDVLIDVLMPRGSKGDHNREKILTNFRVQGIDGGEVALKMNKIITLDGKMPDGRENMVKLLIATAPALLVMKGYAIAGRDKPKDAYDIYYTARNYEGGTGVLAEACQELVRSEGTSRTLPNIASKFRTPTSDRKLCVTFVLSTMRSENNRPRRSSRTPLAK